MYINIYIIEGTDPLRGRGGFKSPERARNLPSAPVDSPPLAAAEWAPNKYKQTRHSQG